MSSSPSDNRSRAIPDVETALLSLFQISVMTYEWQSFLSDTVRGFYFYTHIPKGRELGCPTLIPESIWSTVSYISRFYLSLIEWIVLQLIDSSLEDFIKSLLFTCRGDSSSKSLITERSFSRGDSSLEGALTFKKNYTYFWKPVSAIQVKWILSLVQSKGLLPKLTIGLRFERLRDWSTHRMW